MAKHWITANLNEQSCKPVKIIPFRWEDFSGGGKLSIEVNDQYLVCLMSKRRIDIYDSVELGSLGSIEAEFTQLKISDKIFLTMTTDNKLVAYAADTHFQIYEKEFDKDDEIRKLRPILVDFENDGNVQVLLEKQYLISFNPNVKEVDDLAGSERFNRAAFRNDRYVLWNQRLSDFEIVNVFERK